MKQGYMKTVEVVVAIIFSIIFLVYIVPMQNTALNEEWRFESMNRLAEQEGFRNFVMMNEGCFNSSGISAVNDYVDDYMPQEYSYIVCVDDKTSGLPQKNIFIDTAFITGNMSNYGHKVVRLYYWLR